MRKSGRAGRPGLLLVSAFLVAALILSSVGTVYAQPGQTTAAQDGGSQGTVDTGPPTTSSSGEQKDEGDGNIPKRGFLQITRDILAIVALLVGAVWTLVIFTLGRSFAVYATVRMEPTAVWREPNGGARALVRVSVANTGKLRFYLHTFRVMIRPVDERQLSGDNPRVARTRWTKREEQDSDTRLRSVFARLDEEAGPLQEGKPRRHRALILDPGSELAEEALIIFGGHEALKVQAVLTVLTAVPLMGRMKRLQRLRTFRGWAVLHAAQGEAPPGKARPAARG